MAEFSFDETKVAEALLDLPFVPPGGKSAHDAMMHPGNCVKSSDGTVTKPPTYYGRVVKYSEDEVIVVSHCDACCAKWVWTGTSPEYFRMWLSD